MLLRRDVLDRIVSGEIDTVFRLWRKPTVKAGGRLRTAVGELSILAVDVIDPDDIGERDAHRAGFATAADVRASLVPRPVRGTSSARGRTARPDDTSRPYRVRVAFAGVDARLALRADAGADAIAAVRARLDAIDARRPSGPWTREVLELIGANPGRRAPDLAGQLGRPTPEFKADVRRLKELGLTESLSVGYRLSPRGEAVLGAPSA